MNSELKRVMLIAKDIVANKYPESAVSFLAGSYIYGHNTSSSDLDLVVLFDKVPTAYRESFIYSGFPVEAFVHDEETLLYFFKEVDIKSGVPALPIMVADGLIISGDNDLANKLKNYSTELINQGPPKLNQEEKEQLSYEIGDLMEDIRSPRNRQELIISATTLLPRVINYYLRINQQWSGEGKSLVRALEKYDPNLTESLLTTFESVIIEHEPSKFIQLIEKIMAQSIGIHFDGYRRDAPSDWRIKKI